MREESGATRPAPAEPHIMTRLYAAFDEKPASERNLIGADECRRVARARNFGLRHVPAAPHHFGHRVARQQVRRFAAHDSSDASVVSIARHSAASPSAASSGVVALNGSAMRGS